MTSAAEPGPLALVGSGEFLPQMAEIDRWLLTGRPARAAFLATAAGLEGPETVSRWLALGVEHYRSLGVEPVPVPVIERADANDPDHADAFEGCGLVYLSGGHPAYLAATLRGTAVWAAIERAWRAGAALAGCSAGAMALSAEAPSVRGDRPDEPGLALVAQVAVIPHFDRIAAWDPTLVARRTARPTPGRTVVGIDEDTALVGGPQRWTVMGRSTVTVFRPAGPVVHHPGDVVLLEP